MRKASRPTHPAGKKARDGWPLVVYVWMVSLGFLGYIMIRVALDAYPHPIHWLGGLAGALIGCGVGWLWYGRRGDLA